MSHHTPYTFNSIKFNATRSELSIIDKIVERAVREGLVRGRRKPTHWYEISTMLMDIEATHCNGNPLDLQKFLTGPDFDFIHDVCGIARHMNRETGQLMDCFVPRFSRREYVKA